MQLSHPRTIGPYSLLAKIGEGGLSYVFLAVRDQKLYALKCLKPEQAEVAEAVSNFVREVKIGSQLDHPNILRVVDHGKSGGVYFCVGNLVLGEGIQQIIEEWGALGKRVPLSLSLYLIKECCRILTYLHHKTVFEHSKSVLFHGDLSPDNILVLADGSVRLIDFGSAGQESATDPSRRHYATLFYAPPEILRGESPGTHTDVYALGALAFYLLFGRRPFEADNKRLQMEMIQTSPVPRLTVPGVAKTPNDENALRIFFQKALHKDRQMRFGSVEEMEQALFRIHFMEEPPAGLLEVQKQLPPGFLDRMRKRDSEWTRIVREFRESGGAAPESAKPLEPIFSGASQRKHPRISITQGDVSVEVIDSRERIMASGEIQELGAGGMLVRWKGRAAERGQEYRVSIRLSDKAVIDGMAKALYEVQIQSRSYVGFQFTKLLPADFRTLETYVLDHLPKKAPGGKGSKKPVAQTTLEVSFATEAALLEEYEKNMKFGGLFVEGTPNVQQGEKVSVQIHLPNSQRRVTLKAEVLFVTSGSDAKRGVALQLEGEAAQIKELLFGSPTS